MNHPKVSVIILNWNGLKDTIECLESLKKIIYPNYEVIVVDNGSKGNDADILEEKYKDYIEVVRNKENLGFAEGNNVAIRQILRKGKNDYFLLLNNDTVVNPNFLTELVKVAESNMQIGIVGGKIYLHGTNIFDSAGSIYTNIGSAKSRGHGENDRNQYDKQEEVPMITACCALIRKEILERTHLFDPSFFMYLEELDLNIRIRQLGYKAFYTPKSIVYHKFSKSTKGTKVQIILLKQFYEEKNRMKILMKYYPLKILIKNLHLILLSYIWWEYYFLRFGNLKWFLKLNVGILKSFIEGIKKRPIILINNDWTKWMVNYNLNDFVQLKNKMLKRHSY